MQTRYFFYLIKGLQSILLCIISKFGNIIHIYYSIYSIYGIYKQHDACEEGGRIVIELSIKTRALYM